MGHYTVCVANCSQTRCSKHKSNNEGISNLGIPVFQSDMSNRCSQFRPLKEKI